MDSNKTEKEKVREEKKLRGHLAMWRVDTFMDS